MLVKESTTNNQWYPNHRAINPPMAGPTEKPRLMASRIRETERVLKIFIKLCNNNSRPGYVGCALESLGRGDPQGKSSVAIAGQVYWRACN